MATNTSNLILDGTVIIPILPSTASFVGITTGSTNAAGAVIVLEVEGITNQWVTLKIFNGVTRLDVANLTGASQYGWAQAFGVKRARARRTDATGGVCIVNIDSVQS